MAELTTGYVVLAANVAPSMAEYIREKCIGTMACAEKSNGRDIRRDRNI